MPFDAQRWKRNSPPFLSARARPRLSTMRKWSCGTAWKLDQRVELDFSEVRRNLEPAPGETAYLPKCNLYRHHTDVATRRRDWGGRHRALALIPYALNSEYRPPPGIASPITTFNRFVTRTVPATPLPFRAWAGWPPWRAVCTKNGPAHRADWVGARQ